MNSQLSIFNKRKILLYYNNRVTQDDAVAHWRQRSRSELKAARIFFGKKESDVYWEVLFHCHLAIELALKAEYIREKDRAAPFTHDLGELAEDLKIEWTADEQESLDEITDFGALSRYGDENWFASNATKSNAEQCLEKATQFLSKLLP
ncbi:hypothetical protein A3A67_03695 [Candidatus Peribacteria bacterium RIFCSPLOWO2_01_FULL_51_18]|nr:MAG: hypothetical protein A3A67_03695 [Candidatus Peribacteria bacterium RIFCSPLOWO2_01_FULL_51_18]